MAIRFTQYVLPSGRARDEYITRPAEIEALADKFKASGGWYEAEILTTGEVSFTACKMVDGEARDVEIEICANGPAVYDAVDRLVKRSVAKVKEPAPDA